jgi:hypothetical protein
MPNWYAQYNKSDKVIVAVGYIADPASFVDVDHDVSVGFQGAMPAIRDEAGAFLKKYNETTHLIEDNA